MKKLAGGFSIVEGPLWDASTSGLLFTDGFAGGVLALEASGATRVVVPKRRCSGLALHERGGLVMSGRNVGWKNGEASARLLELDPSLGMAYFNDLGTDLAGRVYVGSVDYDFENPARVTRTGFLHVTDLDGSSRIVAEGIGTANGVAVSPDGRELYFNDTRRQLVRRYAVRDNGDLNEKEPLIDFSRSGPGDGPDGIAVAVDGSVWVALHESGAVAVVGPEGRERMRLKLPPGHLGASVCFGGVDLRTVYVTTYYRAEGAGREGSMRYEANAGTQDGSIFVVPVEVAGVPVPLARVRVP